MPGEIMWIIELNIAGLRYTRELPDLRRGPFRLGTRHLHWSANRHTHEQTQAA
jgi:hypothetical protein